MKDTPVKKFIRDNSWNLIITFIAIIMAWTYLNARVTTLEAKVSEYPSQDWFTLKFETIQRDLYNIQEQLRN